MTLIQSNNVHGHLPFIDCVLNYDVKVYMNILYLYFSFQVGGKLSENLASIKANCDSIDGRIKTLKK